MGWMDAPEVKGKWADAPEELPIIATTEDGGRVYRMPDGSLSFSSPGMSTSNPDTIAKIMEGATPADASTYGNVNEGGKIGAAARSALQGLTFGGGDEIVAAGASLFGPNSYETELARERARLDKGRDKHGATSAISEIAGALTLPLGAMKSAGIFPVRMAKSAGVGGLLSGLYGFGAGEGGAGERIGSAVDSAKWGAGIGAVIPAVGVTLQKVLDRRAAAKAISGAAKGAPSTEELHAAGNAAYNAIDDANVQIKPEAFDKAKAAIRDALRANTGFDELPGPGSLTPNSARVMQIMDEAGAHMAAEPTAALPFKSLDQMRRQAGAAAGNVTNKSDAKAGMEIITGLDDFVRSLGADDVVAGDVDVLKTLIPKARDLWARMSRSQIVDDAIESGSNNYLSGGSSGIRNQFASILRNKKLSRGFSKTELAAMRRVVNGTFPEKVLNLMGGGLAQIAQIGMGLGLGGPGGALAGMATGGVARKASEALSGRNAEIARAIVAKGGTGALPKANPQAVALIEQLMRQGTAAALPR